MMGRTQDAAAKAAWDVAQAGSASWLMQPLPAWEDLPPATHELVREAINAAVGILGGDDPVVTRSADVMLVLENGNCDEGDIGSAMSLARARLWAALQRLSS